MVGPGTTVRGDGVTSAIAVDPRVAAKMFRGLGDPTRLRLVRLLLDQGEMTVGELVEAVGGHQGRVSSHLTCLRNCGLVADRREGRSVYYSVPDDRLVEFLPLALAMASDNAEHIAACHQIE